MKKIFTVLVFAVMLSSCSDYQKALKGDDIAKKYQVAEEQYEKGNYQKAIRLFDEIASIYRGKPQAQKLFYMYAHSLYKTGEYYSASYQFESFATQYPDSEKFEEASFLGAESFAKLSPRYSLDQEYTNTGIEKLQKFINNYPQSQYLPQANAALKVLTDKLEKKAYEIALNYQKTADAFRDYNAAMKMYDNFLIEFPGSQFKEEILFNKLVSSYNLSVNSVEDKKFERLNNAKSAYVILTKFKEDTKYKSKADEMLAKIETELQQYTNK